LCHLARAAAAITSGLTPVWPNRLPRCSEQVHRVGRDGLARYQLDARGEASRITRRRHDPGAPEAEVLHALPQPGEDVVIDCAA